MQEYSVSELSKTLSSLFKSTFPDTVAVTGEVYGIAEQHSSGHIYFSLKEGDIIISATYFKFYRSSDSFIPKNGDKVRVIGEIKTYDKQSKYQINVKKIEYDSVGLLWKQYLEMKTKLEKEGLFDQARKRPIPKYPYRVAVLTALSGAVINDFIVTTKKEQGRYLIDLWNIPVQNIDNAGIIAKTIEKVSKHKDRYDVMVVMRGGGSMEDLAVFNQEIIARAVAQSEIPVISAVGHESDYTIIDFVADRREPTPTAAAGLLSSHYKAASQLIEKQTILLEKYMFNVMQKTSQQVDNLILKLNTYSPINMVYKMEHRILNCEKKIESRVNSKFYKTKTYFTNLENKIMQYNPKNKLESYKLRIINSQKYLYTNILNSIEKKYNNIIHKTAIINKANPVKQTANFLYKIENYEKALKRVIRDRELTYYEKISRYESKLYDNIQEVLFDKNAKLSIIDNKLHLLNPHNIMDRGYALIYQEDKIVTSVDNVSLLSNINIKLKDGEIKAVPEDIKKDNNINKTQDDNKENILK